MRHRMKNIPLFLKAIKNIYKKTMNEHQKIESNFILNEGTAAVPFRHYRFFLELPSLDLELLAILQEKDLCTDQVRNNPHREHPITLIVNSG